MTFTDSEPTFYDDDLAEYEGPSRFAQPEPSEPAPDGDSDGDELRCEQCSFTTKSLPGLRRHVTRTHGKADEPAKPAAKGGRTDLLHDQAEAFTLFFYEMAGGIWSQVDPVCGGAWQSCRPAATEAWYAAAKKNKTVRRILESTENVGVVGQLFVAHMPVMLAVQSHHIAPRIAEARRLAEEAANEPEREPTTADYIAAEQTGFNGAPG